MEEFEVCVFCGEVFEGEALKQYQSHKKKCKAEYEEPEYDNRIEDDYWYGD